MKGKFLLEHSVGSRKHKRCGFGSVSEPVLVGKSSGDPPVGRMNLRSTNGQRSGRLEVFRDLRIHLGLHSLSFSTGGPFRGISATG